MQTEIRRRDEALAYERLFESCAQGLIQQSVVWADVISPISPDEPYFIVAKDGETPVGGLPLYLFRGELGNILTSVPHAGPLGGCVVNHTDRKKVYTALFEAARKLAQELNCVALTIITNPFTQDEKDYPAAQYTLKNFCQVMNLEEVTFNESGEISVGNSALNNNLRRNIRIAKEHGLTVRWAQPEEFHTWYSIHQFRHGELNATPLPEALLLNMVCKLSEANKGGLAIIEKSGSMVGGGIFIWHKEIADAYILSSSGFEDRPNYLLTEFALKDLKQRGIRLLNWQSCQRDSGVYAFKKGWGSKEFEYSILTWTFAGFEKTLNAEPKALSKLYPWHYVAPFKAIERKESSGTYEKS